MLDALTELFRTRGYAGTSLADLCEATGLGKSSLYHYFPGGKEEMGRAVLKRGAAWLAEVTADLTRGGGTPAERLTRMLARVKSLYSGGERPCLLGSFTLHTSADLFGPELSAAFTSWVNALTELAVEAGVARRVARERALQAVAAIEGTLILSTGMGDTESFRGMLRRMPAELLAA